MKKRVRRKVPLPALSQKFIHINRETVVVSSWLRELKGNRVWQVLLGAYDLKIVFDDGRYLIINDYWELANKAGVTLDRHMAPQMRKEKKIESLVGQRFDRASRSPLGATVDVHFTGGLMLTAHYASVP